MELDKIKGLRRNLILIATVELIGGLFMIIYSANSLNIIAKTLGIIAAAYGIISLLVWLVRKEKTNGAPVIITTVLGVTAGAFLIFFTDVIQGVAMLIAGILTAVFGILKLPNMFSLKKAGFSKWALILIPVGITAVLGVIIGLVAVKVIEFEYGSILASVLLGVSLISDCAADIISIAGASETEKNFKKPAEIVESENGDNS
ncbi:MAG: hypothetical protein J1F04_09100 [Oscillospiraceae bacterium]|nr:hypothetical protein [Oscillospiraceae bacterium]